LKYLGFVKKYQAKLVASIGLNDFLILSDCLRVLFHDIIKGAAFPPETKQET